jgi:hypothetical protein
VLGVEVMSDEVMGEEVMRAIFYFVKLRDSFVKLCDQENNNFVTQSCTEFCTEFHGDFSSV